MKTKAFHIVQSARLNTQTWLLQGRAWSDISIGQTLFTSLNNEIVTVSGIRTYNHDIDTLYTMLTGDITIIVLTETAFEPNSFLWKQHNEEET